jgi:hypothetical protein
MKALVSIALCLASATAYAQQAPAGKTKTPPTRPTVGLALAFTDDADSMRLPQRFLRIGIEWKF